MQTHRVMCACVCLCDDFYWKGKVRDTYIADDLMIAVTTDRQSAFDRHLASIPFKGAVLNQTSAWWFEHTKHIVPNAWWGPLVHPHTCTGTHTHTRARARACLLRVYYHSPEESIER